MANYYLQAEGYLTALRDVDVKGKPKKVFEVTQVRKTEFLGKESIEKLGKLAFFVNSDFEHSNEIHLNDKVQVKFYQNENGRGNFKSLIEINKLA